MAVAEAVNDRPRQGGNRRDGGRSLSPLTEAVKVVGIQGGDSSAVQALLGRLAGRWLADGIRVAGVIEENHPGLRKGDGGALLRNVRSGAAYAIYQNLGSQSTACCINPGGVAEACQAVIDDMASADVVILSKFGKLETERGGLLDAFIEAASLGRPVLTAVSPSFIEHFAAFTGPWGAVLPVDEAHIRDWASKSLAALGCFAR